MDDIPPRRHPEGQGPTLVLPRRKTMRRLLRARGRGKRRKIRGVGKGGDGGKDQDKRDDVGGTAAAASPKGSQTSGGGGHRR